MTDRIWNKDPQGLIKDGRCPVCNHQLEYDSSDEQDDYIRRYVDCPNCKWEGFQYDKVTFDSYEDR